MNKETIIQEIIDGIANFRIIPFLGAGMSKPCGALSWAEIISKLQSELNTSSENFLIVAQEYEDKFGRDALVTRLKDMCELKIIDSKSLDNHMKILAMNPPIVYTTNYDCAIEEAAKLLLIKYKRIVGLKDIVDSKHGEKQIIKFHGDFSDSNSIVFTRKDYDKRLNADENPLDILFRSHILGKSVLFLGYGFGDENINYIFNKHRELYGTDNLPKSYIISFENDKLKETELKEKNVITLELSSVEEFSEIIDEVSQKVFNLSLNSQFANLFNPLPSIVLTSFELKNLKEYVDSEGFSHQQKHDKIRETFEGKTIPQDVEAELFAFFENIIKGDCAKELKEAILVSFQHTSFRRPEYIWDLCFELMWLSEYPEFILNLKNDN